MNIYREWYNMKRAEYMVKVLRNNDYVAELARTKEEAREILLSMIPEGSTIGLGGSVTVKALNVLDELRTEKYHLLDRYAVEPDHMEVCRDSLLTDVFITGTNAVTMKGELVNIDCSGSRTAAIMFGPRKVIVVVGANKLVKDLNAAFVRLKEIAPMNCVKEGHQTPCVKSGICEDCHVKQTEIIKGRMCNHIGITLTGHKFPGRMCAIVIAEELGF
mgnify:CR=1 FL=1